MQSWIHHKPLKSSPRSVHFTPECLPSCSSTTFLRWCPTQFLLALSPQQNVFHQFVDDLSHALPLSYIHRHLKIASILLKLFPAVYPPKAVTLAKNSYSAAHVLQLFTNAFLYHLAPLGHPQLASDVLSYRRHLKNLCRPPCFPQNLGAYLPLRGLRSIYKCLATRFYAP